MSKLSGTRITVMGLGLHGGGVASAQYLVKQGAEVTITDLRNESALSESIESLRDLPVRFVLGRHESSDFEKADFVVKNPAVPRDSPYLSAARRVETDISLFLASTGAPLICVTGSKGKSSTATAIHAVLKHDYPEARLGGNITTSPLQFVDSITRDTPVVLELSSFQLGDLALAGDPPGSALARLRPRVAVLTNIYRDHQDYYPDMASYVADKINLVRHVPPEGYLVLPADSEYCFSFLAQSSGNRCFLVPDTTTTLNVEFGSAAYLAIAEADGRWMLRAGGIVEPDRDVCLVDTGAVLPGRHMRRNLAAAGLALYAWGVPISTIREELHRFPGIEHRLEHVRTVDGVYFYNDSAATIPEAALEAVTSFGGSVRLIAGGSDKNLDLTLFDRISEQVAELSLLAGTASDRIAERLGETRRSWYGPYNDIDRCVRETAARSKPGDVVLLSPGCASFGMFRNEFDRGRRFKAAVNQLAGAAIGGR